MKPSETVAVIVATFGDEAYWNRLAARALASVVAQTRQPDALIRIHGGSLHQARNDGVMQADCDFIVVLDADDELDPGYVAAMFASPGEDIRVPFIQRFHAGVGGTVGCLKPPGDSFYQRNHAPIGAMIRRDWFVRVGGFDDWPIYEDWALWMKLEKAGCHWSMVPDAVYRIHYRRGSRNDNVSLRAPTLARIRAAIDTWVPVE